MKIVSEDELCKKILSKNQELKQEYLGQGSFVYELFGIMIHSGGAYGGHYSAYIKDFEGPPGKEEDEAQLMDSWYHFNDSYVKKIKLTDLVSAFGKEQTPKNIRLSHNQANAYMLMYRLI